MLVVVPGYGQTIQPGTTGIIFSHRSGDKDTGLSLVNFYSNWGNGDENGYGGNCVKIQAKGVISGRLSLLLLLLL